MDNIVYLSIGSNEGDREEYLRFALKELENNNRIEVTSVSSIYETTPVGYTEQADFLNIAVQLKTNYSSTQLLQVTQNIEAKAKRNREIRFGPRTLDLDILLYNDDNIKLSHLEIPHPRMLERAFVIIPLQEIAPSLILPGGNSIRIVYDTLRKEGVSLWKKHIKWGDGYEPIES